jgi:ribokinase
MTAQPPFDVVGIGLSTLDVLVRLETLPKWDRPAHFDDICLDGGGPTGTALCAAARLGTRAAFIGTAGTDRFADLKLRSLADHGVDTSQVVRRPGPETRIVLVTVNRANGDRIFNTKTDFRKDLLHPDELDREAITRAEILLTEGFHAEAALAAAGWMHAAGKRVVLDGGATNAETLDEPTRRLVAETDILICGEGFAEALTGETDSARAGRAALAFGPEIAILTRGEAGCFLYSAGDTFHTPAFPVDVVDTTGAGDVFHGAFITGLLRGWDLRTICRFAAAVSAIECTVLGGRTGLPDFQQVQDFLHQHHQTL